MRRSTIFRAFEAQPTNGLTLEIVTLDAHSLSLQYELAAIAGADVPNPSRDWFDGDFAAGARALKPDAGVRGDFPILRKPYEIHELSQAIAKLPR